MSSSDSPRARCPTCDMHVETGGDGNNMPFCSERCRLIDLGRWLNEEVTLPCEPSESESNADADGSQSSVPRLPPGWHDA